MKNITDIKIKRARTTIRKDIKKNTITDIKSKLKTAKNTTDRKIQLARLAVLGA